MNGAVVSRMTRSRLVVLALALSLPLAGCDSGEDGEPDLTGVYRMEVTGAVMTSTIEGETEALPESIALEWPDSLEVNLTGYGGEDREMCSQGSCWFGNATVTVNGSFPDAAIFAVEPDGPELRLSMDEGFLVSPVDPADCDYFVPYFSSFQLRLEDSLLESSAGGAIECMVIGDDGTVLHQYLADVQLTMSGMRLAGPGE